MSRFALCALVVMTTVAMLTVNAEDCWDCSYPPDEDCADPFNSSAYSATGHYKCGGPSCYKFTTTLDDETTYVARGCTEGTDHINHEDYCENTTHIFNNVPYVGTSCYCNAKLCNTAADGLLRGHVTTAALALGLAVISLIAVGRRS